MHMNSTEFTIFIASSLVSLGIAYGIYLMLSKGLLKEVSTNDDYKRIKLRTSHLIDVRNFHLAFGHPVATTITMLPAERLRLRIKWIAEELAELRDAENTVEQIDAIVDCYYFLLGTAVEMGVNTEMLNACFDAVHSANMSKLGLDGKPIYNADGKVIKPSGWVAPEQRIEDIINGCNGRL